MASAHLAEGRCHGLKFKSRTRTVQLDWSSKSPTLKIGIQSPNTQDWSKKSNNKKRRSKSFGNEAAKPKRSSGVVRSQPSVQAGLARTSTSKRDVSTNRAWRFFRVGVAYNSNPTMGTKRQLKRSIDSDVGIGSARIHCQTRHLETSTLLRDVGGFVPDQKHTDPFGMMILKGKQTRAWLKVSSFDTWV